MKGYLTVTEAADRLGVTQRQVLRYIYSGRLNAEWLGCIRIVKAADVNKFKKRPVGRPKESE